jgi:hypothetical protein
VASYSRGKDSFQWNYDQLGAPYSEQPVEIVFVLEEQKKWLA